MDSIEDILEFNPIGPRFDNSVLTAIKTVLRTSPPAGHRLIVLSTTSYQSALNELGMKACFKHHIHVPAITTLSQLSHVLTATLPKADASEIIAQLKGELEMGRRFSIGINDLLAYVRHAAGDDENVKKCFLDEFEDVMTQIDHAQPF